MVNDESEQLASADPLPPSRSTADSKGWGQLVPTGYQNRFFPSEDGPPLFARILESRVLSLPTGVPL